MSEKNRRCPKCDSLGRDKDGDHLFLMEDGVTWCCNKPYHDLYLERDGEEHISGTDSERDFNVFNPKIPASKRVNTIKSFPILGNPDRRISKETHTKFRVRTEIDSSGKQLAVFYPQTVGGVHSGYKARKLPKKFSTICKDEFKGKVPDFVGQSQCPKTGKRILITGGEEDMLAFYECLKQKYPDQEPAVVSLPCGEDSSEDTVAENLNFLAGFEIVVLGTDMDSVGRKAVTRYLPIIGADKCRVLEISEKDCSDMWCKGKGKELINAFFNAKEYRPSNILLVEDILESAIAPVRWGLTYPWDGLTKITYGLKKDIGEIIGLGAAPGAGKSTFLRQVQKHLMFTHREPIAIFDIEEGGEIGLKKLIGSIMCKPIHLPDCNYSVEEARSIGLQLQGLAHFYGGDSENWAEVEDAIRFYISKQIKFIFVDPLSALVEHLGSSEANTELGKIMRAMRKMRKDLGVTFFHANHLNNPSSGKDHGEGGAVRGSQFSGSRAQWKYSTLLLGLEGNQMSEDDSEKHKRRLGVIKDRLGGNTGYLDLAYNPETGNLEEEYFAEFSTRGD